jgi:hypothetical protein
MSKRAKRQVDQQLQQEQQLRQRLQEEVQMLEEEEEEAKEHRPSRQLLPSGYACTHPNPYLDNMAKGLRELRRGAEQAARLHPHTQAPLQEDSEDVSLNLNGSGSDESLVNISAATALPSGLEPSRAGTSTGSDGECLAETQHSDTSKVLSRSARLRRGKRAKRQKQAEDNIELLQQVGTGICTRNSTTQLTTPFQSQCDTLRYVDMGLGVSWCQKYGYGVNVFDRDIKKGDVITQYYGSLISKSEREELAVKTHIFSWHTGQGCDIDGIKRPEAGYPAGSFINHSDTPNCKFIREPPGTNLCGVFAVALEDIPKFSWLSADYGKSFLKSVKTNLE